MRVVSDADSKSDAYAARLARLEGAPWKRWLGVQAPYRWNLRRLDLGRTLEVGCGIGRNLLHLGGSAVGVDPSAVAVETARARGACAFTPDAFRAAAESRTPFDALLFAHVLEHMPPAAAAALVAEWLPYLRTGGRVVLIAPQEAGYRSDPTHVAFVDDAALRQLLEGAGCVVERSYSFPFPRVFGRVFPYNEFVAVGRRQS
jgi:SAM-dependent methyltransferase